MSSSSSSRDKFSLPNSPKLFRNDLGQPSVVYSLSPMGQEKPRQSPSSDGASSPLQSLSLTDLTPETATSMTSPLTLEPSLTAQIPQKFTRTSIRRRSSFNIIAPDSVQGSSRQTVETIPEYTVVASNLHEALSPSRTSSPSLYACRQEKSMGTVHHSPLFASAYLKQPASKQQLQHQLPNSASQTSADYSVTYETLVASPVSSKTPSADSYAFALRQSNYYHERDEFFRVVGVSPTTHGATSRVVVYLAPAPNIRLVDAHHISIITTNSSKIMSPSTRSNPPITSQSVTSLQHAIASTIASTPEAETELKENLIRIDTSRVIVRFSTNDTNEKLVKGEWKGRARQNELYFASYPYPMQSQRRELLESAPILSDKSGFVPLNTLCKAQKMQSLYTASELREAGLFNGALITSLAFKISDCPDRVLENVRLAFRWTLDDMLTEFQDGLEVCYGPVNLRQSMFMANEWLNFALEYPLEWDGRSNLLVEMSKDERHSSFSWPATGGIFFKTTRNVRTVAHKDNNDASGQYPFTAWQKSARYRKVPCLALQVMCPPCFKIVCQAPLSSFHNMLVNVEVSLDGLRFTKESASLVYRDVEPPSLSKLRRDMSNLLEHSSVTNPLSDVRFSVGRLLGEETAFYANSVILAARSPVFRSIFTDKARKMQAGSENGKQKDKMKKKSEPSLQAQQSLPGIMTMEDTISPLPPRSSSSGNLRASNEAQGNLRSSESADALDAMKQQPGAASGKDSEFGGYEISLPDIRPTVFHQLLTFLYTATVEIELDLACELLAAATRYGVEDLKKCSEDFLKQSVNIQNVTSILLQAEKWKVGAIRSFCLDFVLWHFDAVSRTEGFANHLVPKHNLMREVLLSRKSYPNKRSLPSTPTGSRPVSQPGPSQPIMQPVAQEPVHNRMTVSFPNSLLADLGAMINIKKYGDAAESAELEQSNIDALCDVVFKIGADTSEPVETFKAHKAILSSRCEVFEAMFLRSTMRESTDSTVMIPNISPAVFQCLLEYLYTSKCDIRYDNIFELYRAADQYVLQDLKESCEEFVMQELTLDTVAPILIESDNWQVSSIKTFCMRLAAQEFDDVSITPGFLSDIVPRHDLVLDILQGRTHE